MKIKVRDKVGLKKCNVRFLYQTIVDTGYREHETCCGLTSVGTFVIWWQDVVCVLLLLLFQNNCILRRKHRFLNKNVMTPYILTHLFIFNTKPRHGREKNSEQISSVCVVNDTLTEKQVLSLCQLYGFHYWDPVLSCSSVGLRHLRCVRHCGIQTRMVPINSFLFSVSVWPSNPCIQHYFCVCLWRCF